MGMGSVTSVYLEVDEEDDYAEVDERMWGRDEIRFLVQNENDRGDNASFCRAETQTHNIKLMEPLHKERVRFPPVVFYPRSPRRAEQIRWHRNQSNLS